MAEIGAVLGGYFGSVWKVDWTMWGVVSWEGDRVGLGGCSQVVVVVFLLSCIAHEDENLQSF